MTQHLWLLPDVSICVQCLTEFHSRYLVDLATLDPTSEETERESKTMVRKLVDAYKNNEKDSSSDSQEKEKDELNKEQWPVLAMFRNLEHQPGPLKQFWILYR